MERTECSQADTISAIPFAGLGHSLESVKLRAALSLVVYSSYTETTEKQKALHMREPFIVSGFALLVALSREIRGR